MHSASKKVFVAFLTLLVAAVASAQSNESAAAAVAAAVESAPDPDAATMAEFRQGGSLLGQAMYPSSSMYGAANGYQQLIAAGGATGASGGYGGMLRNLYRPSSFGLTDKVRNWVKSFLNRRQYVKPYYNPSGLLTYTGGEDKPVYINGNSYKAISVPLRQIQKYYKPFYGSSGASQSPSAAESAAAAQYFAGSQSSGFPGFGGDSAALYGSESSASSPIFSSSSSGNIFSQGGASSSGLFGSGGASSAGFAPGALGGAFSSGAGLYQPSAIYGTSNGGSFGSYSNSGSSGLYPSLMSSGTGTDDLTASSSGVSGGSASSLYLASSGGRNNDASYSVSNGELPSGYSYEAAGAGSYPVESAYSLSYQRPPQSPQSYGQSSFDKSSFQPVRFGASDGNSFKGLPASGNGHSSSSSALYVSEQSS